MPFDLQISAGSGAPIFRQIVDQVRLAVATGRLVDGDALPSVRALAEKLIVNPNTIAKAYAELSREGIIETQQGKGVFIARPRQMYTKAERLRRIEPYIEALAHEGVALGFTAAELVESVQSRLDKLGLFDVQQGKTS